MAMAVKGTVKEIKQTVPDLEKNFADLLRNFKVGENKGVSPDY
jgi:hypothetical protein